MVGGAINRVSAILQTISTARHPASSSSPRRGRRVSWWARRGRAAHRGRRAGAIVALIGLVAAAPPTGELVVVAPRTVLVT